MDCKLQNDILKLSKFNLLAIVHDLVEKLGDLGIVLLREKLEQLNRCWAFDLPQQYFSVVLTQWLTLYDVAHLDSSLCNRDLRPRFLSYCIDGYVVFHNVSNRVKNTQVFLTWLLTRQIKVKSLLPSQFMPNAALAFTYFKSFGRSLQSISLGGLDDSNCVLLGSVVEHCNSLRELHLCDYFVFSHKENIMETILSRFPMLVVIDVSKTMVSTVAAGEDSLHAAPNLWSNTDSMDILATNLQVFFADGHSDLSDLTMLNMYRSCSRLQKVSVNSCTHLTTASFSQLPLNCPHLTELSANHTRLDDTTLVGIAEHCRGFRKLSANFCSNISDAGVLAVISTCPELRTLELDHNLSITDQILESVYPSCPHLQVLGLGGCLSLTVAAVMTAVKLCPELQTLRIMNFPPEFDAAVRTELYHGRYWLGNWKDRKLTIMLTSQA